MATRMGLEGLVNPLAQVNVINSHAVAYYERLKEYFLANDVSDAKQVTAFLSLIDGKTYSLLRDLSLQLRHSRS